MRKEVQRFLSGFSMAGTCSLGCIDWKLDPLILGLERETDFSMEYRVEKSVDNVTHMDLLMGNLWDVRSISGSDGYRLVIKCGDKFFALDIISETIETFVPAL